MITSDILSIISTAGIAGTDFEMWQKILKHVPATALSSIQVTFTKFPLSINTLNDIYKKRTLALAERNKELLDKTFAEEDIFIKSISLSR
ncbi:MAG: hypothetical protein A2648_02170 [Candidatus Lloydbacteria bacterium RIFCSPHIGHO2_01_FULL_41_20]|uniref:Uncharacterized protein n=1 Tax=Candidatus Lloydbacteria bacterium RIFCSPHIGHO2_01_FULL_41_20 TaxID=1798657 RepID=A0A1G2CTG6_9BACT|nr:MAG: hypothetical protein A2648_02170 [Candidatus Lloydbacteria bacterium RIFCSPHIGHO2_01_FULL_41_20]